MAIANPFLKNTEFAQTPENEAWNYLKLNGVLMPGLVISSTPVIEIEYEQIDINTEDVDTSVPGILGNKFLTQTYVTPKTQRPKTVGFTLLIYTPEDFDTFSKMSRHLNTGIKFKMSHPSTDMWGLTQVYIESISTTYPDSETGWEVNITFIEAIDAPKTVVANELNFKTKFGLGLEKPLGLDPSLNLSTDTVRRLNTPRNPNGKPAATAGDGLGT